MGLSLPVTNFPREERGKRGRHLVWAIFGLKMTARRCRADDVVGPLFPDLDTTGDSICVRPEHQNRAIELAFRGTIDPIIGEVFVQCGAIIFAYRMPDRGIAKRIAIGGPCQRLNDISAASIHRCSLKNIDQDPGIDRHITKPTHCVQGPTIVRKWHVGRKL
jgi:hypothetical protein